MSANLSCPVSPIRINEYRVRLVALFVFLLSLLYLGTSYWLIPAFLVADFFLRSFGWGRYSPLNITSGWIVQALNLGSKPIDQAPKLFAAQMGFVMAGLLLLSAVFSLGTAAGIIAGLIVLFAFLESAFAFCAGCHIYTLVKSFSSHRISNKSYNLLKNT